MHMNQARERPSLLPDSCTIEFAGLPDSFESEGYDRTHMRLPDCQNRLIEEILSVQSEVIVVLHNGSPVEMPWLPKVKGLLEAYLGGQAVGEARCRYFIRQSQSIRKTGGNITL